ncbi:MAG: 30S ribosomal protein S16 [Firmicutes bacterium]|nr:30S ribosomal protein S16 [Bacillota bacterium]
MAPRIRLARTGAKGQPSYRIVVADSRSPRNGRFIEILGHYNPRTQPATIEVDREKAQEWLNRGALPTESAESVLIRAGVIQETTEATGGVDAK